MDSNKTIDIIAEYLLKRNLKFIILLLIAVLIFWFFGRNLDWGAVRVSLEKAKAGYIILAVLIICLGYVLRAKRWQVLLEPITETSFRELFATTTVGFTAVFFVGRAGEIVRPMWLPMRDKRVRPSAALVTLGIERIFDLAAIVMFFSVNLLFLDVPNGREYEFAYAEIIGWILIAAVIAGFATLYVYHRVADPVIKWVSVKTDKPFIPNKIHKIIISILKQLAKSLDVLRDWREVVNITFWTFLLWLAIAIPTWLVLEAFNLPLGASAALFVMGWAAFGSIVPTPGGAAGAFHAATAGGLIVLNIGQEMAAAVSIVMHLVYFAPAVIFGVYYFLRGDINLEGFKNLLSSDHSVTEGSG
ncbi:MAG: flippase-like domain-containing protein [Pyrinomonadaceae bacterium]|nr:flippase-like domain-containing protein [Pyrinomonadaceae bacterium]